MSCVISQHLQIWWQCKIRKLCQKFYTDKIHS